MKKLFLHKLIISIMAMVAIGFLVATILFNRNKIKLEVVDAVNGEVYISKNIALGDEFSVEFIHSVNKSPVEDFYQIREDGIYVVRTKYYGFGAGVQTELEEGQKLEYEDNGSSMVITGIDKKMDNLQYIVGTVSDHVLRLGKEEISLRDTCGRNTRVKFVKIIK